MNARLDTAALVRLLWCVAACEILVGYATIWQPSQVELSAIRTHAHDLYEQANMNEEKVRRAAQLKRAEERVRADLAHLGGQATSGSVTASALHLFDREAKTFRVDIRTILPELKSVSSPDDRGRLRGDPVTLGARGHFRDLVALLADLPRHDVLLEISDVELTAIDRGGAAPKPLLDATIRGKLYRVAERYQ